MTREELLAHNETLCQRYIETTDPDECERLLDQIALTEIILLNSDEETA